MGCGCGKAKMSRPVGAKVSSSPTTPRGTQTDSARVVPVASPYTSKQNVAPAHLQTMLRKTV